MRPRFYQSIRFQVVAGLFAIVATISLVQFRYIQARSKEVLLEHEFVDLFDETNLRSREVVAELQTLREDALALALRLSGPDRARGEAGEHAERLLKDRKPLLLRVDLFPDDQGVGPTLTWKRAGEQLVPLPAGHQELSKRVRDRPPGEVAFGPVAPAGDHAVLQAATVLPAPAGGGPEAPPVLVLTLDFGQLAHRLAAASPRHLVFMCDEHGRLLMFPRRGHDSTRVLPHDDEVVAQSDLREAIAWLNRTDAYEGTGTRQGVLAVRSRYMPRRALPPDAGDVVADDAWKAPPGLDFYLLRMRLRAGSTDDERRKLSKWLDDRQREDPQVVATDAIRPDTEQLLVRHWERGPLELLWRDLPPPLRDRLVFQNIIHCTEFARVLYRFDLAPPSAPPNKGSDAQLVVGMAVAHEEVEADIEEQGASILGLAALYAGAAVLAGLVYVRWLTRPIAQVARGAELYGEGKVPEAAATVAPALRLRSEVGQLARTFAEMVGQVEGQKARIRSVLNAAGDAIITLDRDKLIWTFNPAATEMFGYTEAEVERRHVGRLISREAARPAEEGSGTGSQNILADLAGGVTREAYGWRKDGTSFPIEYRGNRVSTDADGTYTLVVRDITDRRAREAAARTHKEELEREVAERTADLRRANEELKEADKLKDQFLGIVSHELRAPLTVVFGFAQSLQKTPLEEKQARFVQKIVEGAKNLKARVDDLLEYVKLLNGKIELYPESFALGASLRDVAEDCQARVREKNNRLEIDCPDDVGTVFTDPRRVRQVVENLLGNAAKFTRDGTVTLRARRPAPDRVVIGVEDSGKGIRPEDLGKLFRPFTKLHDRENNLEGTGLGLAICKLLCERMGGGIAAASASGRGSTFTVTLPTTAPAEACAPSALPAAGPPGMVDPHNRRVLVIDDDPDFRDLVARHLGDRGFTVTVVGSGAEALAIAGSLRPAVVLLDVLMPGGVSGWGVLAALKNDPATAATPVVMVSMLDDRSRGISLGAVDYVVKPVDDWARLARLIRRHQAGGRRVLVVDDDPSVRELCRRALAEDGWEVVEAENGAVGLDRLRAARPALVLLDFIMPVLDGFGFLDQVRAVPAWRDLPIVVLTNKDLTDDDRRRLDGSVREIIRKGDFDRDGLLHEVIEQVRRHLAASAG